MTSPDEATSAVRTARRGAALVVTLDHPRTRNAIDGDVARQLLAIVAAAEADPGLGVLVLTHTGPVFSSGLHRRYWGALGAGPPDRGDDAGLAADLDAAHEVVRVWHETGLLTVALADGSVHGGLGLAMVLACDVPICTRATRFHPLAALPGGVRPVPDFGATWLLGRRLRPAEVVSFVLAAPDGPASEQVFGPLSDDRADAERRLSQLLECAEAVSPESLRALSVAVRHDPEIGLAAAAARELAINRRLLADASPSPGPQGRPDHGTNGAGLLADLLASPRAVFVSHLPRGRLHAVPVFFASRGDRLLVSAYRSSQKVVNVRRDPRASILLETGSAYRELRGALLHGWVHVLDLSVQEVAAVSAEIFTRYAGGPPAPGDLARFERQAPKRVVLEFRWDGEATWDHRAMDHRAMDHGDTGHEQERSRR
jgi:enoyl-CoA hydratase/carnithine racemase